MDDRRSADLGATLSVLWAAHDLADHVVQTDHQAAGKATSWRAMAGHVGSYHAVQVAALLALRGLAGVRPSWPRTAAAVALSAGTHALLDRRWPVKRALGLTGSPGFARGVVELPALAVAGRSASSKADRLIGFTVPWSVATPLHGPYLADQALHHAVLAVCAAVLAGGRRG